MEENYNDLLNLTADDFKTEEKREIERYRPSAKSGTDNVYTSVVRFLPWFKNPKESIKNKWTSWLVDPDTDEGKYVDCPSSIGQKSILQDVYWKLKKSDSVADQKLAKNFSRRQQFASLVQVIEDNHHPELNGKIMIYQYGVKIHKKLMGEMKPDYGNPHIPFDLFTGKSFLFKITLVSDFNNYDECKFLNDVAPVKIGEEKITEKSTENLEKIVNYLKENSPDLDKYGYREWTDEIHDYVMTVVRNTIPAGRLAESIMKKSKSQTSRAPKSEKAEGPVNTEATVENKVEESKATKDEIPNLDTKEKFEDDINFDDEEFDNDLYAKL